MVVQWTQQWRPGWKREVETVGLPATHTPWQETANAAAFSAISVSLELIRNLPGIYLARVETVSKAPWFLEATGMEEHEGWTDSDRAG